MKPKYSNEKIIIIIIIINGNQNNLLVCVVATEILTGLVPTSNIWSVHEQNLGRGVLYFTNIRFIYIWSRINLNFFYRFHQKIERFPFQLVLDIMPWETSYFYRNQIPNKDPGNLFHQITNNKLNLINWISQQNDFVILQIDHLWSN